MARYIMTVRRKAALRKAQLVSARKRRKQYLNSLSKHGKWRGKRITNRQVRRNRVILGAALVGGFGIQVAGIRTAGRTNKNYGI